MVYMGGLTFDSDNPSNFLKIPNLVAAKRFGSALLNRHGLYSSMKDALYTLAGTGNLMDVLVGYCHLMRQRDVIGSAFEKTEENHRDSIWVTILENPAIKPMAECQVGKVRSLLTPRVANVKLTLCSGGLMAQVLSISSLQITRTSTLSLSSRISKSPTWDL
jgi:hypothetical protein